MDLDKLWKTTLAEIELSVSRAIFQTQFANSKIVSFTDGVVVLGFASALMKNLVEARYYSLIKSILDHHTNQNTSLVFTVAPKKEIVKDAGPLFSQSVEEPAVSDIARRLHIRPEQTFENFAVSTTNQIAYAAATAVAKSPGTAYNPLFLYGGVGVGKTHLMNAVANAILARRANAKIVYCMGEEFLNDIVAAIQNHTTQQFKQKYRSAGLLLIDDVQFLAGKERAQEEFFHTFNAVHREGGQIILTSDRSPAEMAKLEDRLRSRFEGGLTVDISAPDFELRVAIVNLKAGPLGLVVPPDVARLVAANINDARAIEGFLRKLTTVSHPLTPETVSPLLGKKSQENGEAKPARRTTLVEILEAVSSYFDLRPTALKGPKRNRPIARPRQIVMYLGKTELGTTLDDIGGLLGGRDHTTVMHGVETITRQLSTNDRLREDMVGIKKRLWP
ncbi:chromosomal replication initiator protein DnaA [Candidatus Gottesmanbacteria bacterium]|nr:chromosomal replication initiator protein DnaA [Candidatus Gottesmanbacteria bacterium]